jgi:hypothetical protein
MRNRAGVWQVVVLVSTLVGCGDGPGDDETAADDGTAPVGQALVLSAAAPDCSALAARLQAAEELVADLQEELANTPSGPERARLLALLKSARATAARLRAQLQSCLDPPPPLPDLLAARVILDRPTGATRADAALVVTNAGPGPAQGPFRIAFGVTAGNVFREIDFQVPATVTIQPGAEYTTDFMRGIAVVRDGNGVATFVIDALVDLDQVIPETNEGNNAYHVVIRDHRN